MNAKAANVHDMCCAYCGLKEKQYLTHCGAENCLKWFCNGAFDGNGKSHIVAHCCKTKHTALSIFRGIPPGTSARKSKSMEFIMKELTYQPKCTQCASSNIFDLGVEDASNPFIPSKTWCRKHAVGGDKVGKDLWNTMIAIHPENDTSSVNFHRLAAWLVPVVPDNDMEQYAGSFYDLWGLDACEKDVIDHLEEFRRWNPTGTMNESLEWKGVVGDFTTYRKTEFDDGADYSSYWDRLVEELSRQEKGAVESLPPMRNLEVIWQNNYDIQIAVPHGIFTDFLEVGRHVKAAWVELNNGKERFLWQQEATISFVKKTETGRLVVVHCPKPVTEERDRVTRDLQVEVVFNEVMYQRMRRALNKLEHDPMCISPEILKIILGRGPIHAENVEPGFKFRSYPFSKIICPQNEPLNERQKQAVGMALVTPVCLIQGPPGTGKTKTAAAIVANFAQDRGGKILVCAPSNVAVDNLTLVIAQQMKDSNILRLSAQTRDIKCVNKMVREYTVFHKYKKERPGQAETDTALWDFGRECIEKAQIICCTCNSAGLSSLEKVAFSYVLIDEAAQGMEPDCLIAITRGACEKLVLIGDPAQLGCMIRFPNLRRSQLTVSLFRRLWENENVCPRMTLTQNYRMAPEISQIVSKITYGDQLVDDPSVVNRPPVSSTLEAIFAYGSAFCSSQTDETISNAVTGAFGRIRVAFVDLARNDEASASGASYVNMMEAHFIARLVANLLHDEDMLGTDKIHPNDIGIITFYKGQQRQLDIDLKHHGNTSICSNDIEIMSVDGFQGREKEIIILSCVRSADTFQGRRSMGFTDDPQRLNVAMSRARQALIVVGNSNVYQNSKVWCKYFQYMPRVPMDAVCRILPIQCSTKAPCEICPQEVIPGAEGRNIYS